MNVGLFPVLNALMHTPTTIGVDVEARRALLNAARRGTPVQLEALRDMVCDTRLDRAFDGTRYRSSIETSSISVYFDSNTF